MYKKGDWIEAEGPEDAGAWSYLMFTEDVQSIHGNPMKYMGKARPVCQAYLQEPEINHNLFCNGCRHQCPNRQYMIKYVGNFDGQDTDTAHETTKKTISTSTFISKGATRNPDLETLLRREKVSKQENNSKTIQKDLKEVLQITKEKELQRESALLAQQAGMKIVSPFLMQTITSGQTMCGDVAVFFVVLELIEGQNLGDYIGVIHNLTDQADAAWRSLDLIRQLLLAVRAYAKPYPYSYNVHRDLKPENIMVQINWENDMPFQQLKIIDFDMMLEQTNVQADRLYMGGTPGYVHPEAYRLKDLPVDTKRQFSHQWDLYAVGLIIYEILEGHPYFTDKSYLKDPDKAYILQMGEESQTAIEYPELVEIIRKLLCNTAEAYTDIDEVIEDYQHFLQEIDEQWYQNYFLKNWLECGNDFDKSLTYCRIYVHISSEGLKDTWQTICVNINSVVPLIYGKNIVGANALSGRNVQQKEIGAFYFIMRPDGRYVLKFMPLTKKCRVRSITEDHLEAGDEIYFDDVKMVIESIA